MQDVTRNVQSPDVFRRAFYPLTLPPSSVAITLGANSKRRYGVHVSIVLAGLVAMVFVAVSVFLCYAFADRLAQMLGKTAMTTVVRLVSSLLFFYGVQIMWDGIGPLLSFVRVRVG